MYVSRARAASQLMNIDSALTEESFVSPEPEGAGAASRSWRGEISVPGDRVMGQAHRLSRK